MSYQEEKLKSIADAIRSKKGTVSPIKAENFAQEIASIQTTEDLGNGAVQVDFILIDQQTGEQKVVTKRCPFGGSITPPKVGDVPAVRGVCPALTFQEWNHDLEILNNIQHVYLCIGATYIPTDGWSWFKIRVTKTTGTNADDALEHIMYLNKTNTDDLTFHVEDLDGNLLVDTTHTNVGNFNIPFSLPHVGDYWVRTKLNGTGNYSFGNGGAATSAFGGVLEKKRILTSAFLGMNVNAVETSCFYTYHSLSIITLPSSILNIYNGAFNDARGLEFISFPRNLVSPPGNSVCTACGSLRNVSMPANVTFLNSSSFEGCISLKRLHFDEKITSLAAISFRTLYSAILHDMTSLKQVPTMVDINVLANINQACRIVVPDALYPQFIVATNWATYANYIISLTDYKNLNL